MKNQFKIIAISDTHNKHNKLTIQKCDLLLCVGDYSLQGCDSEIKNFCKWVNEQPAKHKVVIQGNHELGVQESFKKALAIAKKQCPDIIFVEHELVVIEGIKIFCSAWTPFFHDWAYNAYRTLEESIIHQKPYIKDKWKDIPMDCDIVATHGPCKGILDQVYMFDGITPKERVGCDLLLEKFIQTSAKIHISGHIHSGHGFIEFHGKKFYNVSICGERYTVDYAPTEIIWER